MNEEQLIEFINWLPTAVPEFKNTEPEQIVQALNQMYESEEGQQMLSQLFTAFQESKADAQSQMFKKGGKLGQLVEKAKKGKKMCCKKKEVLQGGMVNKVAEKMEDGGKTKEKNLPIFGDNNAENTALAILSSKSPAVQQFVTDPQTREFYSYHREQLPDNIGGTKNFEGIIRTINRYPNAPNAPNDTTITYRMPYGMGDYSIASNKFPGKNWKFMSQIMDSLTTKVNKK